MSRNSPVDLPDGYLDFYKNLETWQNEQQIILQKTISSKPMDNVLLLISEQKKPLITDNFVIDSQQYLTVFQGLLDFMSEARPDSKSSLDDLRLKCETFDYAKQIKDFLNNDFKSFALLAKENVVSYELLIFLFDHSIRPFLRLYAAPYQEKLREDTFQHWDFPTLCPVCGAKSHFSRLRPIDNRRFMFCDRCFTEWETRYLQCVHCGNDTPGTIQYSSVENDDAYQIYTCEKCKGYLKTYDERLGGGSTDLFIANMKTIYLDMLAQEKGYTNHDI